MNKKNLLFSKFTHDSHQNSVSLIRTLKRSITCNLLLSKFTPDSHQNSEEVHNLKFSHDQIPASH